jgi:broad specificity phosphatase PhoE
VVAQSAPPLTLYLARHGQTDGNADHRLQGGLDIPLNARGRRQAAELAVRIRALNVDVVYCSAPKRSQQTAELARGSVPLIVLPGLNERRLGKFEGLQIDESTPDVATAYERRSQDSDDSLDGGESLNQFFERIRVTLAGILTQHPSGAILIVGHGAANQMIARALMGLSPQQAHAFQPENGDLYVFTVDKLKATRMWKL